MMVAKCIDLRKRERTLRNQKCISGKPRLSKHKLQVQRFPILLLTIGLFFCAPAYCFSKSELNQSQIVQAFTGQPELLAIAKTISVNRRSLSRKEMTTAEFISHCRQVYATLEEQSWSSSLPKTVICHHLIAPAELGEDYFRQQAQMRLLFDQAVPETLSFDSSAAKLQQLKILFPDLLKKLSGIGLGHRIPPDSPTELELGRELRLCLLFCHFSRSLAIPTRMKVVANLVMKQGVVIVEFWNSQTRAWEFVDPIELFFPVSQRQRRRRKINQYQLFTTATRTFAINSVTLSSSKKRNLQAIPEWLKFALVRKKMRLANFHLASSTHSEVLRPKGLGESKNSARTAAKNTKASRKPRLNTYLITAPDSKNTPGSLTVFSSESLLVCQDLTQKANSWQVQLSHGQYLALISAPENASLNQFSIVNFEVSQSTPKTLTLKTLAPEPGLVTARKGLTKVAAKGIARLLDHWSVYRWRQKNIDKAEDQIIESQGHKMKIRWRKSGVAPAAGYPLFISFHGGGKTSQAVNDQQWQNQIRLYQSPNSVFVAPRAPTDDWNMWSKPHMNQLLLKLIRHFVAFHQVNPNKVFIIGYSAGGDGVFQMAPRMADIFAGASMMAGHPNNVPLDNIRNLPFGLFVGGRDIAYNRAQTARDYVAKLQALRKQDPKGYRHYAYIYPQLGHWMQGLDREVIPWLKQFERQTWPKTVVWRPAQTHSQRFYWLSDTADPANNVMNDNSRLIRAQVTNQRISIQCNKKLQSIVCHLNDELIDLDKDIEFFFNNKLIRKVKVQRDQQVIADDLPWRRSFAKVELKLE